MNVRVFFATPIRGGCILIPLLLALSAHASSPAEQAWNLLRMGRPQEAVDLTEGTYLQDPTIAAVHLAASQRVHAPLETARRCREVIQRNGLPRLSSDLVRRCAWHFVSTRTDRATTRQAAEQLLARNSYDHDARGLLHAADQMDELPTRRWKPKAEGQMRKRRKRDFIYLYKYLRPEDGVVAVSGSYAVLPDRAGSELRTGVYADFYLRPHELVPAGWRMTQRFWQDSDPTRPVSHQFHGGYRVDVIHKTPLMLDATVLLGKERDEGAIRFQAQRYGLGVWTADLAAVWQPIGRHVALKLGWYLTFEGIASMDLRVEGQAGDEGPRGLVLLGVQRGFGDAVVRIDSQFGQALRPLNDRYILRDLAGFEGLGASVNVSGPLSDDFWAYGELEVIQLHPELWEAGKSSGLVELGIRGHW